MPSMNKGRGGQAILNFKGIIYVIGGFDNIDIADCEKYENGKWEIIASLNFSLTKSCALEYKNKLYASGWTGNRIEEYDMVKDTWTSLEVVIMAPY